MYILGFRSWKTLFGTGLCISVATALALLFRNQPLEPVVPFFFLAVIAIIAMNFGAAAGLIGSIAATSIFAVLLFRPLGSFVVADLNERSNLTWMCLFGLSLSFFLDSVAPQDWTRFAYAVKLRITELRDTRKPLDKTLLALLAIFASAALLILWWVLEHPAPPR